MCKVLRTTEEIKHYMGRKRSLVEGTIAGVSFGSASIIIRLLAEVNVYTIAAMRMIIAAIVLAVISLALKTKFKELLEFALELIVMGFLIGFHFILFVAAVKNTSVINATVLVNTAPILTLVIGITIFKVKATLKDAICVLIAFLGFFVMAYPDLTSATSLLGDLEAFFAAFLEAIYLNIGAAVRKRCDPISMMIPILISGFVLITLVAYLIGKSIYVPLNIRTIVLILTIGIVPTAIGHTFYVSSLKGLKSFETATMALLEPLSASIMAAFLFSEIPGPWTLTGSTLILLAVFLILIKKEV